MEERMMFWLIAGLLFVGMIILVGLTLGGQLMKLQTCGEEDIYTASSSDNRGTECGSADGSTVYCNYADVLGKARGIYRERDSCVDLQKHLCCRKCYEALGTYNGTACGSTTDESGTIIHYYKCLNNTQDAQGNILNPDLCSDPEAHRCCRDWS